MKRKYIVYLVLLFFFIYISFFSIFKDKNNKYIKFLIKLTSDKKLNNDYHLNNPILNEYNKLILLEKKFSDQKLKQSIEKSLFNSIKKPIKEDDFIELRNREELHTILWHKIFNKYEISKNDTNSVSYRNQLTEKASFLSNINFRNLTIDKKILVLLHRSLYSWLYGHRYHSFSDLIKSSEGKGIVICTGEKHFKYARSTIDILRNLLNCTLPIEVIYNGENDLSKKKQKILINEFDNIYITDISKIFDSDKIDISGWAIKPFSILASRFEEVILMDADVIYLRNPEELFEEKGYLEKGTLFFKDRTVYPGPSKELAWLKSWMDNPLPETKALRFYNEETKHEMESSTVLIHKTKTILGLLAVCKLNEGRIRKDVVYKKVYGDKETFWIGFDMARQHYYMYPTPSAFIGEINNKLNQLCGKVAHILNGKLLFWNGHIVKNKSKNNVKQSKKNLIKYEAYTLDNNNNQWSPYLS
eukprot:jgi/Orpsp1_1/1174067/evm.model.c7180000048805.2